MRAKLAAALDAARRARRDADAAARAAEVASLRTADLEKQNADLRGRIESADAATALARKQVAETSASLRRGLEAPKNENAATLAAAAEMEAAVARLASTLRARERELDTTRATVATLVRERAEREEALDGKARKCNPPREARARRRRWPRRGRWRAETEPTGLGHARGRSRARRAMGETRVA